MPSPRATPLRRVVDFFVDNSILLLAGTVAAIVWANVDLASYERVTHALHFAVDDVGMVFFFGLAAKEVIEATAPGGVLHSPRRAAVPLVAAVGGMTGPALLYVALAMATGETALLRGWAIPTATDIAFSYLVARFVFGVSHPAVPFLLLLAIADDALGLLILAVFYPTGEIRPLEFFVFLAAGLAAAWWLRRRRTKSFWPYVLAGGALSWVAFYRGGLHPALALVPILPFIPHARRDPGFFADAPTFHDPLSEFEHWWKTPVQVILLFFGLTNAGVPFTNLGAGTWIVLAAIVIGKPLGVVVSTELAILSGLHRPSNLTVRDEIVVGVAAGIGFTVALFFAGAAFDAGPLLDQTKMGALFSFSASVLAVAGAWFLGVGRFDPRRPT
jgi:NhaA family Na+:H+ antiporter